MQYLEDYVVCILQLQHLASCFSCELRTLNVSGSCNIISSTRFNHQRNTNRFTARHKCIKALTWHGTTELHAVRCKKLLTPILSAIKMPYPERSLGTEKAEEGRRICYTRAIYLHQDYIFYTAATLGRYSANNSFNMSLELRTLNIVR